MAYISVECGAIHRNSYFFYVESKVPSGLETTTKLMWWFRVACQISKLGEIGLKKKGHHTTARHM